MRPKYIHTAGPWEVDSGMVQTVAEHECRTPGCGVHIPIAYMDRKPGNGTMPTERDANAYLIAVSPELFDLVRLVIGYFEGYGQHTAITHGQAAKAILDRARAAVAKVEKYYAK